MNEDKVSISQTLHELVKTSMDWVIKKIEKEEGFSTLMLSEHSDGKRATVFMEDSVEHALELGEKELKNLSESISAYVMTFDAWLRASDGTLQPVLFCRAEEQGLGRAIQIALIYDLFEGDKGKEVRPTSDLLFAGSLPFSLLEAA